jgi:hypothetical protein
MKKFESNLFRLCMVDKNILERVERTSLVF